MPDLATARERLVYALDAEGLGEARRWVETLRASVGVFKIGYQLFYREGPAAVKLVHELGARVFLDLKLHDIPYTVGKAAAELTRLGVFMFNVHAGGGRAMMTAAVDGSRAAAEEAGLAPPRVLGVTVLTSLDDRSLRELGFKEGAEDSALRLAGLARESGLSGVVASPREAKKIRELCGPNFIILCPGVRPAGSDRGDQARVATPGEAIKAGADYLVMGRHLREAADPESAAQKVLAEIAEALAEGA